MRERRLKKACLIVCAFIAATIMGCSVTPESSDAVVSKGGLELTANAFTATDYANAMVSAVKFYDANKCGPDVALNNVFSWRGACHKTDGNDVGVNLTGGYHDAGDHVKFGLPQGYSASVLGWALYEFGDSFTKAGNKAKMIATLKFFTDYFLRSHPNANTFYYQVGDGDADHTYWGAPEAQTGSRPTLYKADASHPATDVLGQTSAALTLMYLNYKATDATYAAKCLTAARELYNMAKANKGYSSGQSFYQSGSYGDDLAWAAVWLGVVDGIANYKTDIANFINIPGKYADNPDQNKWTMCWDNSFIAVYCKMAQLTGEQKYKDGMNYNMNYWKNSLTKTPGGLRYLNNWGVLRYSAAASMIAMLYRKQTGDASLLTFAKSQIDYMLGTNPAGLSYEIGFGSNYPKHPHHRAANGYTYANGGNLLPAKYVLTGALVGGPDQNDRYLDDGSQYQYTEVAIDYNAGFVGALAGLLTTGTVSSSSSTSKSSSKSSAPTSSARSSSKSSAPSSKSSSSSSTGSSGGTYTTITAPFTFEGVGVKKWKVATVPNYINTWNLSVFKINGVSFLNVYISPSQLPAKQNGYYNIDYEGTYTWSHFEVK